MELTIIQQDGGAYIDSREVAEAIGKKHQHLLRDIRGYIDVFEKFRGASNFGRTKFFLESTYVDAWNREKPCFLLTKMGCEMVATKLTGEKGVMFSFAYVKEFNRLEQTEREQLAKQAVTPRLAVFNKAIRTVIGGLNAAHASADTVMTFLRDSYKPFGIPVADIGDDSRFYSASLIARALGVYSRTGRPHAHAVSAIIGKLDIDLDGHVEIAPYGVVGFSARYDAVVAEAVQDWLITRGNPHNIPHEYFEYHVWYDGEMPPLKSGGDYDDVDYFVHIFTDEELNEICGKIDDCGAYPYGDACVSTSADD